MRPNSLRPEFVISGAALLVALTMFAVAVASRFTDAFDDFDSDAFTRLVETDISAGVAVIILTAIVAVSYVVGAVVVQRTFEAFIGQRPENLKAGAKERRSARMHRRLDEVASLRVAMQDLDVDGDYVKQLVGPVLLSRETEIGKLLPEAKAEFLFRSKAPASQCVIEPQPQRRPTSTHRREPALAEKRKVGKPRREVARPRV